MTITRLSYPSARRADELLEQIAELKAERTRLLNKAGNLDSLEAQLQLCDELELTLLAEIVAIRLRELHAKDLSTAAPSDHGEGTRSDRPPASAPDNGRGTPSLPITRERIFPDIDRAKGTHHLAACLHRVCDAAGFSMHLDDADRDAITTVRAHADKV